VGSHFLVLEAAIASFQGESAFRVIHVQAVARAWNRRQTQEVSHVRVKTGSVAPNVNGTLAIQTLVRMEEVVSGQILELATCVVALLVSAAQIARLMRAIQVRAELEYVAGQVLGQGTHVRARD
jgi:hypothetical protein